MTSSIRALRLLALAALVPALVAGASGFDRRGGEGTARGEPVFVTTGDGLVLAVETVVSGLDTPWDMVWAPDGAMWVTERPGRISRIDVGTGERTVVGELDVVEVSESGLMGMAFHPGFPAEPWVYAVHSYSTGSGRRAIGNRLVRMRWEGGRLGSPQVLLDGMPGNSNHNGSKITFGPDGMLYLTMGEAGNRPLAQDLSSLGGKVLRLTPEGRPAGGNPFGTAVWSYGHRNPQGLVFDRGGRLYSAEHGPNTDDEVNRILEGRNYGWPAVAGFCDTPGEQEFCRANRVVEPVESLTPTVGISGIDAYDGGAIPGWRGSLLVTSLGFRGRGATLFRIELNAAGDRAARTERLFAREFGRLRDVLVGPDGAVYLATSNQDGRGQPGPGDDRILRVTAAPGG